MYDASELRRDRGGRNQHRPIAKTPYNTYAVCMFGCHVLELWFCSCAWLSLCMLCCCIVWFAYTGPVSHGPCSLSSCAFLASLLFLSASFVCAPLWLRVSCIACVLDTLCVPSYAFILDPQFDAIMGRSRRGLALSLRTVGGGSNGVES
jgi:hypothetical protein